VGFKPYSLSLPSKESGYVLSEQVGFKLYLLNPAFKLKWSFI